MDKYKEGTYKNRYFCGGSNIYLNLITCDDKIDITSTIQSYVLHWYHTHPLHTGMDRMKATIFQNFYWPGIRNVLRKEVTNCDTCQHTTWSNIKYGKLPAKEAEETPHNKLCVHLIGPYVTRKRDINKT